MLYLLLIPFICAQSLNASQVQINMPSHAEILVLNEKEENTSKIIFSLIDDECFGPQELTDITELLKKYPKIVDAPDSYIKRTGLKMAVLNQRDKLAKIFIMRGANLEAISSNGNTHLMHASNSGNEEITNFLITGNAILDARNSHKYTALMLAASQGREAVIEMLIAAGAAEKIQNEAEENMTAFEYAMLNKNEDAFICAAEAGRKRRKQYLVQLPQAHAIILDFFPEVLAKMVEEYTYSNNPEDLAIMSVYSNT